MKLVEIDTVPFPPQEPTKFKDSFNKQEYSHCPACKEILAGDNQFFIDSDIFGQKFLVYARVGYCPRCKSAIAREEHTERITENKYKKSPYRKNKRNYGGVPDHWIAHFLNTR